MLEYWQHLHWPGILADWIHEGSLVFDVGANIGKMTYAYLGLGARVIAVEPQAVCVEELQHRFRENERVEIVHAACGSKVGQGIITTYGHGSTISTMVPDYYWGSGGPWQGTPRDGREAVTVTTLDALIEQYGMPAWVKVDVEGYELEVLQGLSRFVPLSFEFHPYWAQRAVECMQRLLEIDAEVEFNHTEGEQLQYVNGWTDCNALAREVERLNAQHGRTYFGNIYARRKVR